MLEYCKTYFRKEIMNKNNGIYNKLKKAIGNTTVIDEAKMTVKKRSITKITITFFIVFFIGSMLSNFLLGLPTTVYLMSNDAFKEAFNSATIDQAGLNALITDTLSKLPTWFNSFELFATIGALIVCIGYCTKFERRRLFTLGFVRKGAVKEALYGLLAGFVMSSVVYGIMLLSGQVSFGGFNYNVSYVTLIAFFFGCIVQGFSEEVLFRGYYMVSGATTGNVITAVFTSSVLFSVLHVANEGITALAIVNILLFGLFNALYFIRRGSIWSVAMFHAIWNFSQGNIFGCNVSGINFGSSLFTSIDNGGNNLFSGGAFGPEGGLAVTIVLVIGLTVLYFMKNKDVYPEIDFSKEFYSAF